MGSGARDVSVKVINVSTLASMERRIKELERQMAIIQKDRETASRIMADGNQGMRRGLLT